MPTLDETHDPARRSWVPSANDEATDFPVQNLPWGRFRPKGGGAAWRIGVAIGDQVLDLADAREATPWPDELSDAMRVLAAGDLNAFMAMGPDTWRRMRRALSAALSAGSGLEPALRGCLRAQADVEMGLPCTIGDYTDFYTGIHHATTVGRLFRPENPLMPNYKWVPIGYHGRASSIVPSGRAIRRPCGQSKGAAEDVPVVGPTARLDHEVELGFVVGTANALGERVDIARAGAHLFGVVLFNDWSARDIQPWEYQPLGPFIAKNFASTVSPWVVTMDALAPFRAPLYRPEGEPAPLAYLDDPHDRAEGALDVQLEAWLQTAAMRERGEPAARLSSANAARSAWWTPAQLVAHHTVGGCNLNPGDLLGSGTLSGERPEQAGSMLELTKGGREPVTLPDGEQRRFLEDGDSLSLRGRCERAGARGIGFGPCEGTVLPALPMAAPARG